MTLPGLPHQGHFHSIPVRGYKQKARDQSKVSPLQGRELVFPGHLGNLPKNEKGACVLASSLLLDVSTLGITYSL